MLELLAVIRSCVADGINHSAGVCQMNTGSILSRINFGLTVASNRLPGARVTAWPTYSALRSAPRRQQVDGVVDALLGGEVSPETRQILLSGEHPFLTASRDSALAGDDRDTDPSSPRDRFRTPRPLAGLDQVIGLALGSPEFQRR